MGDATLHTPSPEQEFSQDRSGSSSRRGLSRSLTGALPMELDSPTNSTLTQHQPNALGSTPMFSTNSEPHDVRFPHVYDQRRTSVIPDLQYPNVAQDNDSWLPFAGQSAPMDQGSLPPLQPSMPRNSAAASVPGGGLSNGVTDRPASPSSSTLPQRSRSLASTEPEQQLRQPVEHLIKLATVREDRMSRQREIFDLRSGELSAFSSDASRATKTVQDQMDLLKLQAEELHAQAGQMLQEANKTRELADRLIASVETLYVDAPNATKHVDHLVERSEQMTSFMRKTFDWLAALRVREQGKVEDIQKELAELALAEMNRLARMEEERRKAEAQEKAARREEEEREAAKKKAEEEEEAARERSYVAQRAAVMEKKRKANEAQAQSIQAERERAERERRFADVSGSGSNAPPTVFPGVASEHTSNPRLLTSLSLPPVVPSPTRTHARGKGQLEVSTPLSQPPQSPNKARAVPATVYFVPAQTEVGRAVNTDSPFSSTTLASELHPRIVEPSQPLNHLTHAPAQDQMPWQGALRMTPRLEQRPVEIKREPSVEELPSTRSQAPPSRPSPQIADMDDGRQRHLTISRRTPSRDENADQRNQASPRPPSRANSLHVAQSEENRRRSDPSTPVPPEQASLTRSQDYLHDRAVQGTDVRGRTRQDSMSSDRSPPHWNDRDRDRRSRSPAPRRPLSRSPSPYTRKRVRSGTPRYDSRQAPDYRRSQWRHTAVDRDRGRERDYDYDRERQGDSPRRYRPPARRTDTYRPSPSPAPPSPQQYRYERPSPRPGYRSPSPEYETRRFAGSDAQDREPERINTNVRHYEPTSAAEVRHTVVREEQQGWQRPTPSPSDRDRTPTPPPRLAEAAEVGLLDRIDMNQAEYRGRGRGRLLPGGVTRGGPNSRRGVRGGLSGGRGRGVESGSTPALLARMTGATNRGTRAAHAPSLSDRMQQD
jgi:hypothetical protein